MVFDTRLLSGMPPGYTVAGHARDGTSYEYFLLAADNPTEADLLACVTLLIRQMLTGAQLLELGMAARPAR
jgi:hypothetical protein